MKPMPTSIPKIWRDDDCNVYTDAFRFKEFHQQFIDKKIAHTVAVIMKDLWQNHALFYFLATAPYLEVALHGWEHKDYSQLSYEECNDDIKRSLEYWKENSMRMVRRSKPIDTFFSPWNREGENIKKACQDNGLKFCNVKKGMWTGSEVRSFHWWNIIIDNWNPKL